VTMSQIAESTGIGRATLYKYFPDAEAILRAWHQRQISRHLEYLREVRARAGDAGQKLEAVLEAYALINRERLQHTARHQGSQHHAGRGHGGTDLAAFLHRDDQVAHAEKQLRSMIRELLAEAAKTGAVRDDVPPDELANYCIHSLSGAAD